jgi:hypothetical protein
MTSIASQEAIDSINLELDQELRERSRKRRKEIDSNEQNTQTDSDSNEDGDTQEASDNNSSQDSGLDSNIVAMRKSPKRRKEGSPNVAFHDEPSSGSQLDASQGQDSNQEGILQSGSQVSSK